VKHKMPYVSEKGCQTLFCEAYARL